jgi:hypothetical protein
MRTRDFLLRRLLGCIAALAAPLTRASVIRTRPPRLAMSVADCDPISKEQDDGDRLAQFLAQTGGALAS